MKNEQRPDEPYIKEDGVSDAPGELPGILFFAKFWYSPYWKITFVKCKAKSSKLDSMYILKVKGTDKIPDYIQLRDDAFTLLAYFRVDRPEKALVKAGLAGKEDALKKIILEMPYGKVQKLEI